MSKTWEISLTDWIVFFLVLAIAIHHFLYDRDAKKVPDYVKNSIQFSSDESDGEKNEDDSDNSEDGNDTGLSEGTSKFASTARKLANLDKFMNYDARSHAASGGTGGGDKDNAMS